MSADSAERTPSPADGRAPRARTLRGVLRGLLIVPLLPLAIVSGALVWTQWQAHRAAVYQDLAQLADSVAGAVDQEVEIGKAMLDTLAASELIDAGDWAGFRRLAIEALRERPDSWIALGDATGLQVMRTFEPVQPSPTMNPNAFARQNAEVEWHGRRLPVSTQGLSDRVLRSGRMSSTGLYFGAAIRRPAVAIGVPVRRGDRTTHVLILGFSPDRLTRALQQSAGTTARASIIDASGRVVAAVRHDDDATGITVPAPLAARLAEAEHGFHEGESLRGTPVIAAFRRGELTDWTVLVGLPAATVSARVAQVAGGWALLLVLILALSAWAARSLWLRLAPPLVAMGRSARMIQQGTLPQLPASGIAEIDELGALLRDAARAEARSRDEALRRAVAEEAARSTQAQAQAQSRAQARFREAIEHLPHGVVIHDAERRFEYLNARAVELLGRPAQALLGRRDDAVWPADVGLPYVASLRRAIAQGSVDSIEWTLPGADGGERVLAVSHAPLRDVDGRLQQVLTIVYDVTERHRSEAALREADRQKDEFLAILSHELRNPLAPIVAAGHVIRSRAPLDPDVDRAAAIIERQARQLARLVDDLLEVSRITQGRIELRPRPEALADVVAAAIESARPAIDAAGHRLEVTLPAEPIVVSADAARLSQAVLNVLNNAARYTPPGGRIAVRASRDERRATLVVEDDGIGIDAGTLPRIFDLFVQGEPGDGAVRSGLGIGLALARRLIEMHGGTIAASSDGPGRGSRFEIVLPLSGARPLADPAAPPSARAPRRDVLVVDDNEDAATALRLVLELDGHAVRVAHDGRTALAAVAGRRPDVVLLDVGLPDIDGLEIARRLRAELGDACPRLIAISGWGQERDRRRALDAGCERHFTKPVDPAEIAAALERPPAPEGAPAA